MKTFLIGNATCKLGETAAENWAMLSAAGNKDIFFHLTSFPSGYVILECERDVEERVLLIAAEICKVGTKYRNIRGVKVDYCLCNNVVKGEKVGEAVFKSRRKVRQIKL